jgi:putative integral membrane protein (TIGR02587 family)
MLQGFVDELRDQGRGVPGALLVTGLALGYTMEVWWHGWQLPVTNLFAYAVVGLAAVLAITRYVGFRQRERGLSGPWRVFTDFAELLVQSFVTAYAVLLLFGIVDLTSSPYEIARLGLVLVVPLGFGASRANHILGGNKGDDSFQFPKNLGLFALGAIFLAAPVAPTQEMELMAAHAGWWRLAAIVAASILASHLMLYELEFKGQEQRIKRHSAATLWGSTFVVYLVAFVVSVAMLAAFGHFSMSPPEVWVQEAIVLSFMGSIGGSAAQMVL